MQSILNDSQKPVDGRSQDFQDLIDNLLQKDPNKRPSIKDLITDYPYVRKAVIDLYFDISKDPTLANPILDQLGKSYFTSALDAKVSLPDPSLVALEIKQHPKLKNVVIKTFTDGTRYEGNMLDGLRHGQGKCIYRPLSKYREYDGAWVNDLFEGQGTLIFRDGTRYVG